MTNTATLSPLAGAVFLAIGFIAGAVFFGLLRLNARLYAQKGPVWRPVGLSFIRLLALGAVLAVTAQSGTVALLVAAVGVMIARPVMTKMVPP